MPNVFVRFLKPSVRGKSDAGLLLLRLAVGLTLAFNHGLPKLLSLEKFVRNVTKHGFPVPELLAPLAMLSELAGGLLIALGLLTRAASLFVLATMLGAALVVHRADPFSKKELALAYALVAVVLLVAGPGRLSLDARLSKGR